MKVGKYFTSFVLCLVISCCYSISVFAGSYSVTQSASGSFLDTNVSIVNKLGYTMNVSPYVFNSPVTNVSRIMGYYRPTTIALDIGIIDIDVYYSTNGSTYTYGTRIENINKGALHAYTINIGGSTKTVYSIAFIPNLIYAPGISYSISNTRCTRILTDNTPPIISLQEQIEYSNTSVIITTNITDSESGISETKWAMGSQISSYFTSNGTDFTDSFSVSEGGTITVYAKDKAGNESTSYYAITKLDKSPPVLIATASSTYNPTNTILVTALDSQSGIALIKWAYGSYTDEYFTASGSVLSGSKITVTKNGVYTIFAVDNAGNTSIQPVTVAFVDNLITVSHSLNASFSVNPDLSVPFCANDILLNNQSRIKVQVSLTGISNAVRDAKPINVSPTQFSNWNTLTAAQSAQYIALGIRIKETTSTENGWYAISNPDTVFGAGLVTPVQLGVLNPNGASGNLILQIKHGLAFTDTISVTYYLNLLFETV